MPYWMNQRNILILCVSILVQLFVPNPYEWVGMCMVGVYTGATSNGQLFSKTSLLEIGLMLTGIGIGGILKEVLA